VRTRPALHEDEVEAEAENFGLETTLASRILHPWTVLTTRPRVVRVFSPTSAVAVAAIHRAYSPFTLFLAQRYLGYCDTVMLQFRLSVCRL